MATVKKEIITAENEGIELRSLDNFPQDFQVIYEDKFRIFQQVKSTQQTSNESPERSVLELPKLIIYFPKILQVHGNSIELPGNIFHVLGVALENLLRFQNALIFAEGDLAYEIVKKSINARETLQHKRIWKSISDKVETHVQKVGDEGEAGELGASKRETKLTRELISAARQHHAVIAAIHLEDLKMRPDVTDSIELYPYTKYSIEQDAMSIECIAVSDLDDGAAIVRSHLIDYFYNKPGTSLYQLILTLADDTAFTVVSSEDCNYAVSLYEFNYAIHSGEIKRVERRLEKLTDYLQIANKLQVNEVKRIQERQALYASMLHLFTYGTVDMLRLFLRSRVFQVYFDVKEFSLLLYQLEQNSYESSMSQLDKYNKLTKRILYDLYTLSKKENLLATWVRRVIKRIISKESDCERSENVEILDVTDKLLSTISQRQLFWTSKKNAGKAAVFLSVRYFTEYLLIWSSVSKRCQISELLLEYTGHQIVVRKGGEVEKYDQNKRIAYQMGNAIVLSYILKRIAGKPSVSRSDALMLKEGAGSFVKASIGLFEIAIEEGKYFPDPILNTRLEFWNNRPVIELAYECYAREFFTHDLVQGYLTKVWNGELDSFKKITLPTEKPNSWIAQLREYNIETKSEKQSFQNTKLFLLWLFRTIISPRGTFILHGLAYLLFVIAYTVNLIFLWQPFFLTGYDYLYFIWAGAYLLDEIQQIVSIFKWKANVEFDEKVPLNKIMWEVYKEGQLVKTLLSSLREYFSDFWHTLDTAIIIWFVISITLRCISVIYYSNIKVFAVIVRVIYGILAIFYFVRTFEYVLVKRSWGLLMYTLYFAFLRMIKFLVILFIMTYCFSITQYVLFDPSKISAASVGQLILFPPFFQIFGEYALDGVTNLVYNFTQEAPPGSPVYFWESLTWLAYVLIGIWVLISNVLLLNIMISYFTNVYDEVLDNAKTIYKALFLTLVNEYQERSYWPPPFNLLSYLYKYLVLPLYSNVIYFITCKCLPCRAETPHSIKQTYIPVEKNSLLRDVSVYLPLFSFYNAHDIVETFWERKREKVE